MINVNYPYQVIMHLKKNNHNYLILTANLGLSVETPEIL